MAMYSLDTSDSSCRPNSPAANSGRLSPGESNSYRPRSALHNLLLVSSSILKPDAAYSTPLVLPKANALGSFTPANDWRRFDSRPISHDANNPSLLPVATLPFSSVAINALMPGLKDLVQIPGVPK